MEDSVYACSYHILHSNNSRWLLDSIPQRVWHMENESTLLIPNVREKEITSVCCIASNAYGSPQHCEDITVWSML